MQDDALLTEPQTAKLLGLAVPTLKSWRCRGACPVPYLNVGNGGRPVIRYRSSAVHAFLAARTIDDTQERS